MLFATPRRGRVRLDTPSSLRMGPSQRRIAKAGPSHIQIKSLPPPALERGGGGRGVGGWVSRPAPAPFESKPARCAYVQVKRLELWDTLWRSILATPWNSGSHSEGV